MTAANVTKKHIEEFLGLVDQVHALRRKASDFAKLADVLDEKITEFVLEKGGKDRTVLRSGYVLAIKSANGSVSWKHEFVTLAGAEAAEKLVASAPSRDFLSVEKA